MAKYGDYACTDNNELKYAVCHAAFRRSDDPYDELPGWTTARMMATEIYEICDTREEAEKALDEAMQNIIYAGMAERNPDFCEGYEICPCYLDDVLHNAIDDSIETAWYSHDDCAAGGTYHIKEW